MNPRCVGVVGAGTMGTDVALDLSSHGFQVLLKDVTPERLETARARITEQYRFVKMVKRNPPLPPLNELLTRIALVTSYDAFAEASIVIENVTERFEIKREVYSDLSGVCAGQVLYGVNTSCISITKIASLTPRPENVIGMHFLNPVPLKTFVEVIRGYHTTDETVEATRRFLKDLHKTCVVVRDHPGFVTNRVLMLTINECAWVVQDGVASAADVDTVFKAGFAHKMGPLATADLIGLDTILDSLHVLYDSYRDPKFRPCPLLTKLVDAGMLGRKSGKGFFAYRGTAQP